MKPTIKRSCIATLALAALAGSAHAAAVIFDLSSGGAGGSIGFTADNTTYLDPGHSGGWADLTTFTLSDDTQGTGLTMTLSNTGQTIVTQASNTVGLGTSQGSSGWDNGDTINITFNQDVTLNSIWFNAGQDGRATGITPTVHTTTLTTLTGSSASGSNVATELVWDDSTVLVAGQVLSLAHNSPDDGTVVGLIGLQVTAIPEPSSFALIGLGCLSLVLRRRRA
jgi:hypothetical protein